MITMDVDYSTRQKRLVETLGVAGLDAFALNPSSSLIYFTGLHFHLMERPVVALLSQDYSPVIVLPELEVGKLSRLPFPVTPFTYGEDPETWNAAFQEAFGAVNLLKGRVGIEPRNLRLLEYSYLHKAAPDIEFVSGEDQLAEMRMIKDHAEQTAMQQAVHTAQSALESILPLIQLGMTEQELAGELVIGLLKGGSATEIPFSPIVASGPNSANPHAFPTARRLQDGDLLLIDWGANSNGYYSDLTRTFCLGKPEDEMIRVAKIVQASNQAAREKAGPGVTAQEVDRAARQVIDDAGYGDFFIHRTGHGLGMESHEHPYIREGNLMELSTGMTFTIEPGIYLPGRWGVRIEDNVVITEDGVRSFSDMPRALRTLGD